MRIFGNRFLIVAAASIGIVFYFSLTVASRMHRDFERFIAARLQSDLIANELGYRTALMGVEKYNIVLVGDIMLSRGVGWIMVSNADYRYPFLNTAEFLSAADITFGNLEGPISSRGVNLGSIYSFRADPSAVQGLEFAGFDVVSIANNHIFDWGADALNDTVSILKSGGIESVGAGVNYSDANKPVVVNMGGTTVGFLAYTTLYPQSLKAAGEGAGVSDIDKIENSVEDLAKSTDIVVVSMHWGEEYEIKSNEFQKELAHRVIDSGADIVVGHHPHVIEEIEKYNGGWIIYSLGNFVFDQTFSDETRTGMVANAIIKGNKVIDVETKQVHISETFQPEFINL